MWNSTDQPAPSEGIQGTTRTYGDQSSDKSVTSTPVFHSIGQPAPSEEKQGTTPSYMDQSLYKSSTDITPTPMTTVAYNTLNHIITTTNSIST